MDNRKRIARERLDLWFVTGIIDLPATFSRPMKGWINSVRYALGMTGRQLALRLGVSPASASALEKREREGSVSLKTMERAAEAMDCTFFYGFRPNGGSFEGIVRRRAEGSAQSKLDRINRTMLLEDQQIPSEEAEKIYQREVLKLVEQTPGFLWNEDPPGEI